MIIPRNHYFIMAHSVPSHKKFISAEGPDDRRKEGLPVRDSNPNTILQRDVSYH